MMENELKRQIVQRVVNCELEDLEKWLSRYNKNLYKLEINQDLRKRLEVFFMINDFLNINNVGILEELNIKLDDQFKGFSIDLVSIENIIKQMYTESIEKELQSISVTDRGTIDFEGANIPIKELEGQFSICTGNLSEQEYLSLGSNENLSIQSSNGPIYGYLSFGEEILEGMSPKEIRSEDDIIFDDFYGVINSTRGEENSIKISANPSYILALDEITEEDKKAAKEKGLPIYFIDREKLAITEKQRLEKIEQEFFRTFDPNYLKKLISTFFNNRNSFRNRPDLQEKYFDSLEMQIKLDIFGEELEKCFDTKAERRAKLCLQYIYDQLEQEESKMPEDSKESEEMNIKFLKNNIRKILDARQNKLIQDTVDQAIKDIEEMGELSEIEKAYYMYLKLGTVFKHDPTYTLENNRRERAIIYQYEIDKDGYGICKSMVEEYQNALKRIGIDSEVTEVVPDGKFTHRDLVIKTKDGKKYFTNLIGDLYNIQNGRRTRRFGVGEEEIKRAAFDSENYYERIKKEIGNLTVIPQEELEEMDKKFNHSYKGIYTNDMFQMLRNEIKDKAFLEEFFGTKDEDELLVKTFEFLMEHVGVVNSYNVENMGFYEATRYYDRLIGSTFSEEEQAHFRAFSDMYTIDENREKKPGYVLVLNVNQTNSETGKKENVNLYYEYSDIDKRFNKVEIDEVLAKNYILVQNKKPNEQLNEIIREIEGERSYINDFISQEGGGTPEGDFDYTDK